MTRGKSISKLSSVEELQDQDLFLMSEFNVSSDSLYYTRAVAVSGLVLSLSDDAEIQPIKLSVQTNAQNIATVSGFYEETSASVDEFSEKFRENEATTRRIPALSGESLRLSGELSDVLWIDREVEVSANQNRTIDLELFAKNRFRTSYPISRFIVPTLLDGLSRHMYIILENSVDTLVLFSSSRQLEFFSDMDLNRRVPAGRWIFDMKEISQDRFYIGVREMGVDLPLSAIMGQTELDELWGQLGSDPLVPDDQGG